MEGTFDHLIIGLFWSWKSTLECGKGGWSEASGRSHGIIEFICRWVGCLIGVFNEVGSVIV